MRRDRILAAASSNPFRAPTIEQYLQLRQIMVMISQLEAERRGGGLTRK